MRIVKWHPQNKVALLENGSRNFFQPSFRQSTFLAWLFLLFLMFSQACLDSKKDEKAKAEQANKEKVDEAVPVEVVALTRGKLEATLKATANLEAEEAVIVPARSSNRVLELLVEEGVKVKKDQILVRLENDAQRTALERTKVQLEKAKREFERKKSLHEKNLISTQEYNDATSTLEELELALKDNQRELDYTVIRAPISGTVTKRMINLGDQVNPNQNLFEIVDFDSIVARIYVPEKHLPNLRKDLKARITSTAFGNEEFSGRVLRVAPTIDPKTGTIKVTVGMDRIGAMRPGLFVDVNLILETREQALLIPKKALVYDDADMYVYSLNDNQTVTRKLVTPRLTERFFVEPLEGFTEGERIVIAGQAGLKDGGKVTLPGQEPPPKPENTDSDLTQNESGSEE